jgi:hypothetical protein
MTGPVRWGCDDDAICTDAYLSISRAQGAASGSRTPDLPAPGDRSKRSTGTDRTPQPTERTLRPGRTPFVMPGVMPKRSGRGLRGSLG